MANVAIIDCGVSNLTSILNAFHHQAIDADIISDPGLFRQYSHLVLPGVGAFIQGMRNLHTNNLVPAIKAEAAAGKPILGICLGMQLLADHGEEHGIMEGLGLMPGVIRKIKVGPDYRLPHVGWNQVQHKATSPLLMDIPDESSFYFVHSFAYQDLSNAYVLGTCDYDGLIIAIVQKENIYGVQFHPEKSQAAGLKLVKNFIERC